MNRLAMTQQKLQDFGRPLPASPLLAYTHPLAHIHSQAFLLVMFIYTHVVRLVMWVYFYMSNRLIQSKSYVT